MKVYPLCFAGVKQDLATCVRVGCTIFLSGVSGREIESGKVEGGDVRAQTRTAWKKIKASLEDAGASLEDIVKYTVYLTNMKEYGGYIAETKRFFRENCPSLLNEPRCQTVVEVSSLFTEDMLIEIEPLAVIHE